MKHVKLLVAILVMLVGCLLGGCGGNDKFAGTWVGGNKGHAEVITIEKNGDSYLVHSTKYGYDEAKFRLGEYKGRSAQFVTYEFRQSQGIKKDAATLKGNQLILSPNYFSQPLTYVENKQELLFEERSCTRVSQSELPGIIKDFRAKRKQAILEAGEKSKNLYGYMMLVPTFKEDIAANTQGKAK